MLNRLTYNIKGIPPRKQQDLISYLKSIPEFNQFETKIHLDSPDGGKTKKTGTISGSMEVGYIDWVTTYKDYSVTVTAVLGEIYIICSK